VDVCRGDVKLMRFQVLTAAHMRMTVLGCCGVCSGTSLPTFQRYCCIHYQGSHIPDVGDSNISETSANFYQTTQRNTPEDSHP
jgi:hypothetical protein